MRKFRYAGGVLVAVFISEHQCFEFDVSSSCEPVEGYDQWGVFIRQAYSKYHSIEINFESVLPILVPTCHYSAVGVQSQYNVVQNGFCHFI